MWRVKILSYEPVEAEWVEMSEIVRHWVERCGYDPRIEAYALNMCYESVNRRHFKHYSKELGAAAVCIALKRGGDTWVNVSVLCDYVKNKIVSEYERKLVLLMMERDSGFSKKLYTDYVYDRLLGDGDEIPHGILGITRYSIMEYLTEDVWSKDQDQVAHEIVGTILRAKVFRPRSKSI